MAGRMKSLTEFSGVVVRMAATALAEARRSLPAEERPAEAAIVESSPPGAVSPEEQLAPDAAAVDAAAGSAAAPSAEASVEADDANAALDAAVAKATGLSGDRLGMLRAAVEAAGKRTADVRVVRVFGPEEQVTGAKAIGGRQYLVDYLPQSMKQVAGSPKDERGRGGRGRGGGGGRSSGRGAGAGATGGFSMDSLRDDRKSERGGGRRPGGAPRGGPKK
jgi:hypothetical protein